MIRNLLNRFRRSGDRRDPFGPGNPVEVSTTSGERYLGRLPGPGGLFGPHLARVPREVMLLEEVVEIKGDGVSHPGKYHRWMMMSHQSVKRIVHLSESDFQEAIKGALGQDDGVGSTANRGDAVERIKKMQDRSIDKGRVRSAFVAHFLARQGVYVAPKDRKDVVNLHDLVKRVSTHGSEERRIGSLQSSRSE